MKTTKKKIKVKKTLKVKKKKTDLQKNDIFKEQENSNLNDNANEINSNNVEILVKDNDIPKVNKIEDEINIVETIEENPLESLLKELEEENKTNNIKEVKKEDPLEKTLIEIDKLEHLVDETIEDIKVKEISEDNKDIEKDETIISQVDEIKKELNELENELKEDIPKQKKKTKKRNIIIAICSVLILAIISSTGGYYIIKAKSEEKEAMKVASIAKTAKEVNVANTLRNHTAKKVKKQKNIPSYSLSEIHKLDMSKPSGVTAADLKLITRQGLVGLEQAFVNAEKKYKVNALFLVAIASLESANGTICFKPNNMFGYGSKGYPSKEANIYDVADGIGNGYLQPGSGLYSGKTISDVNKRYASSSTWDTKVANNMHKYYSVISARRKAALKKL